MINFKISFIQNWGWNPLNSCTTIISENLIFFEGAMFYGEHGVGKSLLVKAAAGECNVPFLSYSCGGFLMGDNGTERV